jgi:putative hemin transport protein
MNTTNTTTVREHFEQARQGGLRAKEAAESLSLSEGAAIEAHAITHGPATTRLSATPLRPEWLALLKALGECGPLMALTRNESVVHEKTGVYEKLSGQGPVGLAVGADIDLRLFFDRWHAGYVVRERAANADRPDGCSLQFFDRHGIAVHKIYTRETTHMPAWEAACAAFAQTSPAPVHFEPAAPRELPRPDADIDAAGLAQAWAEMTDTHQFFGLLKRFVVERQQALRLMENRFSRRVPDSSVTQLLEEAAVDGTPIMAFVGSPGCIQIHSGPVQRIVPMATPQARWINVLDPGFNLHLREDRIGQAWVVEKPTEDGTVSSLEVFDRSGELMVMFFGARKPGQPEREAWRQLLRSLRSGENSAVAA